MNGNEPLYTFYFVSKGEMIDNVNPCTIVLVSIAIAPDETPRLKAMGECLPLYKQWDLGEWSL